jgi:hypothetical protein
MEELRSTEVLDREILEDARRKAQRLLKTADETAASGTKAWEKKTEAAVAGARSRYAEQIALSRGEIMARLPLDKRRSRLEKIESLLKEAAASYLAELPRKKLLSLLETELKKCAAELSPPSPESPARPPAGPPDPAQGLRQAEKQSFSAQQLGEAKLQVSARGLSKEELQGILKGIFPQGGWTLREGDALHAVPGSFPAVVVDTPEARIIVSADAVVGALLQDKRAELAAALLGEEVLDA